MGNNRIVANAAASVVQSTQYYPFGMPFADATGQDVQPYKYNNKELDGRNGLNMYDSNMRYYDFSFPHTPMPDPLSEKYYNLSPYSWVANNPINAVDLKGDTITTMIDGNKYTWGSVNGTYGFVDSNGALYSGNNSYALDLTNALNTLRTGDVGKALVDYLAGDAGNMSIRAPRPNSNEGNSAFGSSGVI